MNASDYNEQASGRLWRLEDLPPGLRVAQKLGWDDFTEAVRKHQRSVGMPVADGKLGPATLATLVPAVAVQGIDISGHNTRALFDWRVLAEAGQSFCYVKAGGGEGRGYTSKAATWQVAESLRLGWATGLYFFADASEDPRAAMRRFLELHAVFDGAAHLPPAIDLEWLREHNDLSDSAFRKWLVAAVDELRQSTGRAPVVYTGPSFWREHIGGPLDLGEVHLWAVDYSRPMDPPKLPPGFSTWTFRQWTGSGKLSGYLGEKLDRNVFNGTLAVLQAMVAK